MINSILVPLDGSDNATRALDFACDLAGKYDAKVALLHVMQPVPVPEDLKTFARVEHVKETEIPRELAERVLEGAEIQAKRHGLRKVENLARHGVTVEAQHTITEDVSIGDMLLNRVADESVDLIVMGAYGHSRVREMVLGGVTRHLLADMTVPVLLAH